MSDVLELEKLVVRIVGDAKGLVKPIEQATESIERSFKRIETGANRMIANVESQFARIPRAVERDIVQPLQRAEIQSARSSARITSNADAMARAMAIYGRADPLAGLGPQLSALDVRLAN